MADSGITIALCKGRVLTQLLPLLERAKLDTSVLTRKSRALVRKDVPADITYLLLKPDDVPTYVECGAADLGVVGRDVLLESHHDLYVPLDLGIGRCRLVVAGPKETELERRDDHPLRVATKFPSVAKRYFLQRGVPVTVVYVRGSVELAPLTGLSDVIVDLVETGETLRQNGLHELVTICDVTSVVVANRVGLKLRQEHIRPLLKSLRAGVTQ